MKSNKTTFSHRVKQDLGVAENYGKRKLEKHFAEMKLIERGTSLLDQTTKNVLDAPCGVGRATIFLASKGYQSIGLDLGIGAVEVAKRKVLEAGVEATIVQGDILSMMFPDHHFDGVLCFRVYHHFPDELMRAQLISELCRVAKRYVLISYFSPLSVTSLKRKLRSSLGLKTSKQHATSLSSIEQKFQQHGFSLVADIPQQRFIHTLHLAVFESIPAQ